MHTRSPEQCFTLCSGVGQCLPNAFVPSSLPPSFLPSLSPCPSSNTHPTVTWITKLLSVYKYPSLLSPALSSLLSVAVDECWRLRQEAIFLGKLCCAGSRGPPKGAFLIHPKPGRPLGVAEETTHKAAVMCVFMLVPFKNKLVTDT